MKEICTHLYKEGRNLVIEESFLRDIYINQLKSLRDICKLLENNISVEGVRLNLLRYKIERTPEQAAAARQLNNKKTQDKVLELYGVDNISKVEFIKEKKKETCLKNYGVANGLLTKENQERIRAPKSEEWKQKVRRYHTQEEKKKAAAITYHNRKIKSASQRREARLKKYGSLSHNAPGYLSKERGTCLEKYGVPYPCMRKECRHSSSSNSKPNRLFRELLEDSQLEWEPEFHVHNFSYDFRCNNTLIEINPTATHNLDWSPFGEHRGIELNYHSLKTATAVEAGYDCMHVWDWDDYGKIIQLLSSRIFIYARKCEVREVSTSEARDFLSKYHLQSYLKGQPVRLGLYYGEELVQVMTFGKPRYNKKHEWELLRLCTRSGEKVVGGASKLFKHFLNLYKPNSVISYCDLSKFSGKVYSVLGFKLQHVNAPSIHWYNPIKKQHITDSLLRQHGFDRLFNTSYGKGTSNTELMRSAGFSRVADCGQAVYVYYSDNHEDI